MATDRFLIAPLNENSGLQKNLKPWLIPDSAFAECKNAYVFRGRLRKRFGSRYLGDTALASRLRYDVGNYSITLAGGAAVSITDAGGNATGTVPGTLYQLGQRFVIGAELDTVTSGAAGAQPMTMTGGTSTTHTFNIGTGAYNFVAAPPLTQIYFFPNPAVTSGAGSIAGILPNAPIAIGTQFSINNVVFTVNALGTPANLLVANGSATTATLNTTTGAFNFVGVFDNSLVPVLQVGIQLFFYPALPVMGLLTYDSASVSDEPTFAFDTRYSYQYITGSGWDRIIGEVQAGASMWSGSNSDFFWSTSFRAANAFDKVLFVTNFNENEANFMRYYLNGQWNNFSPLVTAAARLISAQILVVFKGRLLAFNTWEGNAAPGNNYQNRMRYSGPFNGDPTEASAFRQDIPGKGGGIDAPTSESIITVEFVKDRLIVYFERSTYELVFTQNQINPFQWQQINTELGAESTFSIIPIANLAIGVGNVGIHACNGANVERIDVLIPDEVFGIHNTDSGVERVYGIRDYFVEMIYWTFPSEDASVDQPYPNRVLVFNYATRTWSYNEDSITVFGYIQPDVGTTWDSQTVTWDSEETWDEQSFQALFRQVLAGNQEGYTFIVDADEPTNAAVLSITDIALPGANAITIKAIDHNLRGGEFVYITGVTGTGNLNLINNKIYKVDEANPPTKDTFTILYPTLLPVIAGVYSGAGLMARVSNIDVLTKEYNFYVEQGRNCYVSKVEFQVDRTSLGEILVDYYVSTAPNSMVADSSAVTGTGCIIGNNVLETFGYPTVPFELEASRVIHAVYFQANGEFIQLRLNMTDEQMMRVVQVDNGDGTFSYSGPSFMDFQLHSMIIYATPTSSRMQ